MPDFNVSFAKIVATPTPTSWSQAFNTGSIFMVLSLTIPEETETPLGTLGKNIINSLEAELLTLQEKNLVAVKQALTASLAPFTQAAQLSLVTALIVEDIVYVFIVGSGKVMLKRETRIGTLLECKQADQQAIHEQTAQMRSASGQLKPHDTIILQTEPFATLIPPQTLQASLELELPTDIAESLTPHIHETEDGAAAAIIFTFLKAAMMEPAQPAALFSEQDELPQPIIPPILPPEEPVKKQTEKLPIRFLPHLHFPHISPVRVVACIIAITLGLILVGSMYFTKKQQKDTTLHTKYESVSAQAKEYYDSAQSLSGLNKPLEQDDYKHAEDIVVKALPSFPQGSDERKQLDNFLQQIRSHLDQTVPSKNVTVSKATATDSPYLATIQTAQPLAAAKEDDTFSLLFPSKITQVKSEKKTDIITGSDWKNPQAIAAYNGNLYLLDTKAGIRKFTADSYTESAYFSTSPDLSSAVSLAIDGSVWILTKDGKIAKFLKGEAQTFSIKGLATPFSAPREIVTDASMTNLYVLDPQNKRIVAVGKNGTVAAEYTTPELEHATFMDINEAQKTIFILTSQGMFKLTF